MLLPRARWIEVAGALSLQDEGGVLLPVPAMEIFTAVFSGVRHAAGYQIRSPAEDIPDLSFSRFAAEAAVSVEYSEGHLSATLGVLADGDFIPHDGQLDQVIASRTWFPIRVESVSMARSWLTAHAVNADGACTLATLVALRATHDFPGHVIDNVVLSASELASAHELDLPSLSGLNGTLYPYQSKGVAYLQLVADQSVGCILGDEMGLGKTLQIIAMLLSETNSGRRPSLVITPATLVENWRREFGSFAPGLRINIHAGSSRSGISAPLHEYDVTVVSYETAVRDEALLSRVTWNALVLDEAQNIKNPEAQRTRVVKRISRRVSVAVTGTPVENRLSDLWSITDFAFPTLLGTLEQFSKEYSASEHDAARLGTLISPLLLRRKVLEVAKDLPEKIEIPQPLLLPHVLALEYEAVRKQTLSDYGAAGGLVALGKLRMFCCGLSASKKGMPHSETIFPKLERLFEILDEVYSAGEKALIFTSYTECSDMLLARLELRYQDHFFASIDGRSQMAERQPTIDRFFKHPLPGTLVLNPKAAGVGLNITAANHVIHFNPEWNPALTDQATARSYRRKQTRPVTVHHLYFVGTVEEAILDRSSFKRQLAAGAVKGHQGDAGVSDIARALQASPLESEE